MNSSIREALERLFREFPVLLAGSTPSESEVVAVETQLGRRLDPNHRDFVLQYGGALVGSVPIIYRMPASNVAPRPSSTPGQDVTYSDACPGSDTSTQ